MKSHLFLKAILCFSLLLGGFSMNKAHADHISSSEMYVDYIGTGPTDMTYVVTFITFRVCISNNLILFPTVNINASSPSINYTANLTLTNIAVKKDANGNDVFEDTLDNLCPDFSKINSCRVLGNTSYSGYTMRIYKDTVTIPQRSADLKFSWSSCCRLLSYVNIDYGSGPSFYLEVGLNNLIKYNNSTPRYKGQPFAFLCTNQPGSLSNLPNDPDLDSLRTVGIDPQQSPTLDIVYYAGYTGFRAPSATPFGYPTGTSSNYKVSPVSGKATFTPPAPGKYALGYRTFDYDKATGQQLSYTSRDLVISVLNCTNLPPYIDSIPQSVVGVSKIDTTGGDVKITACPQAPLQFKVNARSNNPNGLIYMRPTSALPPGMTIVPTVTGGTGFVTVDWTPTAADVGTHVVSVLAVDSTCAVGQEITLRSEFTFTIIVRPGLDAGPDLLACPLGDKPVQLGTNANPTSKFTWTDLNGNPALFLTCTDCPDPLAGPTYSYTYVVTSDDDLMVCKNSDTVTVYIDTSVTVTAPQDLLIVCRPDYRILQAVASGLSPLANVPCGTDNPIACLPANQDTVQIGGGNSPAAQPMNTPFYSGKTYHKYQFIIPKQDLLNAGLYSGTLNSLAFLHVNPTVLGIAPMENMTVSLACIYDDKFPTPVTNNSFYTGLTPVVALATYSLTANAWNQIDFATPYSWDTTQNLLVDICMGPMTTPNPSGTDPVAMTPGRTIQKSDNGINVCGGNTPTVQSYTQRPVIRFNYCPSPALPFSYWWQPGTYLSDSNAQNPTVYVAKSMDYAVYTIGRNGCRVRDSLHIVVPTHNVQVGPQDTFVCRTQEVYMRASGGDAYQWFEVQGGVFTDASSSLSCTNCQNPVATPAATTTYAVVFTNDVNRGNPANPGSALGCPDTLYTTVNINPLPPVRSSNRDTTIGYGKSVQLFAKGASSYTWTPIGSLSDPNSPAPIASPRETTNYIVSGQDSNGCIYRDTVKVTVDYKNNILVPSAFTPNGDGRNDVFKVINPNFQRLMEFRVFNRWGQEIFATTDIGSGWDGTWKGIEQDMGNYQYIIRVGSPDGNVETYKGDINLIR